MIMKNFRLFILLISGLLFGMYQLSAQQVAVNLQVTPPYSPYLSDYTDNPNKIILTLNLISGTANGLDVYMQGEVTGESGISIATKSDYKPATPIHLNLNMPYYVTTDMIADMYAPDSVEYTGIDPEDIAHGGVLPEDVYQICIKVFDYNTDNPVSAASPSGCSAPFIISYLDTPMFTTPDCGSTVETQTPQNLYINWTMPATVSPVGLHYLFRMVEIDANAGLDPEDVVNNENYPSIYEEDVATNFVMLTQDKVQLIPGNIYAYTVKVIDDNQLNYFKNDGVSEACWFVYKQEDATTETGTDTTASGDNNISEYQSQFELIPQTHISGRMFYKLPNTSSGILPAIGGNQQMPSGYSGVNYYDLGNLTLQNSGSPNQNSFSFTYVGNQSGNYLQNLPPPFTRGLLHQQTENIANAHPLANTQLQLVARLAVFEDNNDFPVYKKGTVNGLIFGRGEFEGPVGPPLKDLDGHEVPKNMVIRDIVLDVTETDENGNFSFDFSEDFITAACQLVNLSDSGDATHVNNPVNQVLTDRVDAFVNPAGDILSQQNPASQTNGQTMGQGMHTMSAHVNLQPSTKMAYICLKIEPVNEQFCAPDVDIFAMPGDVVDVGNQVSLIKTFNAEITVKSDSSTPQINGADKPLKQTTVQILRNKDELSSEHPGILQEEGQKTDKYVDDENGHFKLVAIDTTDVNGNVLIHNLVKFKDIDYKPYLIKLSTRNQKKNQYEDVFYNYKNLFERLSPGGNITNYYAGNINQIMTNHWYQPPTIPIEYELSPKDPEIKGRVMASSNMENVGLKDVKVILFTQNNQNSVTSLTSPGKIQEIEIQNEISAPFWLNNNGFQIEKIATTNAYGFFEFTNLTINANANGPFRRLMIIKHGYKTLVINPFNFKATQLNRGEVWDLKDINMQPRATIKGEVVDEDGNPVQSYVRLLDSGPYQKTKKLYDLNNMSEYKEIFDLGGDKYDNRFEIQPLSSQYFKQEYEHINAGSIRKAYIVYKKLHRLQVAVKAYGMGQMPVTNANIVVGDSLVYGQTDAQGKFTSRFASPDSQFVLKVSAGQYAPQQLILNLPVSKKDTIINVYLKIGKHIQGTITDHETHQPIEGAKIFTELQNTDGHHLYLETTTGAQGHYQLDGIPVDVQNIEIHIVKEGNNPSYVGYSEMIDISHQQYFNYELTPVQGWDLTSLNGFPVQVESFKYVKANNTLKNKAVIGGYLYQLPGQTGFRSQESNLKIPFQNVVVRKTADGKMVSVDDSFNLNEYMIPVKVNEVFSGTLKNVRNRQLTMNKNGNGTGTIGGLVNLDLESFRFAYNFNGNIYIGDSPDKARVEVFSSGTKKSPQDHYVFGVDMQLGTTPINNYKVFGFDATADKSHSILRQDMIFLPTVLHTQIPMGNNPDMDLKIPIGKIRITKNDIKLLKQSSDTLHFNLEKWHVKAKKNWYFDMNEEAIVLPEVLIISNLGFTATVRGMRVRPTSLREGNISISDGLKLGNIAPLELAQGLRPVFNYDAGIGHYRISVVGTHDGRPAGVVRHLQKCDSDLEFESVGLISDDTNVLTISKKLRFYDILDVEVNQIMSGDGYFSLKGTPDLGIPNFVPYNAIVNYRKINGKLMPDVENLQGKIDCSNNVVFNLDDKTQHPQHIEDGLYTMYGDFTVSPSALEEGNDEDSFTLRGFLTKTHNEVKIDVIKLDGTQNRYKGQVPQDFHLKNKRLHVYDGQTIVTGNRWQPLHFMAKPDAQDQKGMDENNEMHFKVNGNISMDGDNIKMDGLSDNGNAPLSSLKMAYNFKTSTLTGSIAIPPLQLGYASITQGLANMQIDPHGFYFGARAKVTYSGVPLQGGIVTGYTTSDLGPVSTPILYKFKAEGSDRVDLSNGIKGFYLIGQIPILEDEEINLVVTKASIDAGLGAWFHVNYDNNLALKIGGYGYFDAHASIACLSLNRHIYVGLQGGYDNNNLYIMGCGVDSFIFSACGVDVDKTYGLKIYNDDFEIISSGCND